MELTKLGFRVKRKLVIFILGPMLRKKLNKTMLYKIVFGVYKKI